MSGGISTRSRVASCVLCTPLINGCVHDVMCCAKRLTEKS